jgi:hypothetical protein
VRVRTIAAALAVTAVLTVVTGTAAQASRHHTAPTTPLHLPAALHAAGGPGAVPWSTVGEGWLLATWGPAPTKVRPAPSRFLVLVAPTGPRYVLAKLAARTQLLAWSGDGQRALLQVGLSPRLEILNLPTATVDDTFTIPQSSTSFFQSAGFTRPSGLALYVDRSQNTGQRLERYSLDGTPGQSYPTGFSRLGRFTGAWLSSPDGTQLVMGASKGLAIVSNGGTVVAQLPLTSNSYCSPVRWWSATTVLARCGGISRLYVFPTTGGAPYALTRAPRPPDNGDLSAWHVGGGVFVQVASACGSIYLAQLHGSVPVMVHVPGVVSGKSVYVVGASATGLALLAARVAGCVPEISLQWFTPSTMAVHVVLGPPASGGSVDSALIYPPPLG